MQNVYEQLFVFVFLIAQANGQEYAKKNNGIESLSASKYYDSDNIKDIKKPVDRATGSLKVSYGIFIQPNERLFIIIKKSHRFFCIGLL